MPTSSCWNERDVIPITSLKLTHDFTHITIVEACWKNVSGITSERCGNGNGLKHFKIILWPQTYNFPFIHLFRAIMPLCAKWTKCNDNARLRNVLLRFFPTIDHHRNQVKLLTMVPVMKIALSEILRNLFFQQTSALVWKKVEEYLRLFETYGANRFSLLIRVDRGSGLVF